MPSNGFQIQGVSHGAYRGPDFKEYAERWWNDPSPPNQLPNAEVIPHLMNQVAEDFPGGKQSCSLTAQLNGLIVRDGLTVADAVDIQQKLVNDPVFDGYWVPFGDSGHRGWSTQSFSLAFILERTFGIRIGTSYIESDNIVPNIMQHLKQGYAVALMGQSVVEAHTRLAFETDGSNGQFYIHDSKYSDTSGFYDYSQLNSFQTDNYAIVF